MTMEPIAYTHDGVSLTGWLVRPAGPPRGAVVVFPTIRNKTAASEHRAALLAEAGFVVLIADFYGTLTADMAEAQPLAVALRGDVDRYRGRIGAAIATLRELAPGLTLSAIGYCMGGQAVLEAARAGEDLALAASFHGILATDRPASAPIAPRILVCHGDADPLVPRTQVLSFWEEMDAVGTNWHFHSYAGVRHGFTDPGNTGSALPAIGYDASADRQSWAALISLLNEIYA
jgi:dienelactone hydrolase